MKKKTLVLLFLISFDTHDYSCQLIHTTPCILFRKRLELLHSFKFQRFLSNPPPPLAPTTHRCAAASDSAATASPCPPTQLDNPPTS